MLLTIHHDYEHIKEIFQILGTLCNNNLDTRVTLFTLT